ncbi:MAG: GTP cyclohydrolase I FolE [Ignavibacteria bacterium]
MINNLIVNVESKTNKITNNDKIAIITYHFSEIMRALGIDLQNDSVKDTPKRVAKMYVNEIFYGLNKKNKPKFKLFRNSVKYENMLIVKDIQIYSVCEHHFLPFIGTACVAYIPNKKLIGLSKINRIVDYFCRQPQLQEKLTNNILDELSHILHTENVLVTIKATHLCVMLRGIKDRTSETVTLAVKGKFKSKKLQNQFYLQLNSYNENRTI